MERRETMDIGLPANMTFQDQGTGIVIARKWFAWHVVLVTLAAIVWDGLLVHWFAEPLLSGRLAFDLKELAAIGAGLAATYYAIAGWINRTRISVDHRNIDIRHSPLPWFGAKTVKSAYAKQLYVKDEPGWNNRAQYDVMILTHAGHNIRVVGGLSSDVQAAFIEQEIEKFLSIDEARVVEGRVVEKPRSGAVASAPLENGISLKPLGSGPRAEPLDIGMPEKISYSDYGTHIEIVRRWFTWYHGVGAVFLGVWLIMVFDRLVDWLVGHGNLGSLFDAAFLIAGAAVSYYVASGLLNRTWIHLDRENLRVRHGPLPWIGNRTLKAYELQQLYVREKAVYDRGTKFVTFDVRAITKTGQNVIVVSGLATSEQGLFIEQTIERYLGIEPAPVRGEV